jgi:type II secretory pathway component PulF
MPGLKSSLVFYEELSTLIASGTNVVEAFNVMSEFLHDTEFKKVALGIKARLAQGNSLAAAMADFSQCFPAWQRNIVKYGELSGTMKTAVANIAEQLRKEYQMRRKLVMGLAYPVLLLHLAIFLLPIASCAGAGGGMHAYLPQVFKVIVPLYLFIFAAFFIKNILARVFSYQYDFFIVSFPFTGRLVKAVSLAKFVGVLQCLCAAGVNVIEGWSIAAASCENLFMKGILLRGAGVVKSGGTLGAAFSATGAFDGKTLSLIAIGEKAGTIDAVLGRVAFYAHQENETAMNLILMIIPVFIYVAVAAYIGWKVIAFYSDYFAKAIPSI